MPDVRSVTQIISRRTETRRMLRQLRVLRIVSVWSTDTSHSDGFHQTFEVTVAAAGVRPTPVSRRIGSNPLRKLLAAIVSGGVVGSQNGSSRRIEPGRGEPDPAGGLCLIHSCRS